jgi:hypothetical protein
MSSQELVKAVGAEIQTLPETEHFLGLYAEHTIPAYDLADSSFEVFFQMDNETNRLAQVLVRLWSLRREFPKRREFPNLEAMLRSKYGPPTHSEDDERYITGATLAPRVTLFKCTLSRIWVFPTTTIHLKYNYLEETYSMVSIRYFPTAREDLKKL